MQRRSINKNNGISDGDGNNVDMFNLVHLGRISSSHQMMHEFYLILFFFKFYSYR
jgi:hypothetical protein